jgi:hypothetical protein
MATRSSKKVSSVFQLKVTLREVAPPIWRRMLVPANITLGRLHFVLNEAMGWTCSHLHSFSMGDRTFGDPRLDEDGELDFEDERKVKLDTLVGPGQALRYEYDFGDSWEHDIVVEAVLEADHRLDYPLCVAGARACPPEDCGGTTGYENLLESLADERHDEHNDSLTWVGGCFDAEGFDANRTNRALRDPRR